MFRCLFRLIVLVALAVLVLILLVPGFINQAGNSLLNSFNNSAVSGLAQFVPANISSDQNNHLQISVSGLTAGGKYHVTLDNQVCGGSPIIDLGLVIADNSGRINQEFALKKFDTSQTWYVDVHEGNDPAGIILACGKLVINSNGVALEATPILSLSPVSTGQVSAPTIAGGSPTPGATPQTGFPNTGVKPGSKNSYDNYVYPRKY